MEQETEVEEKGRGGVEHMYQSINSLFCRLKKMEQETEAEEKGRCGAWWSTCINQSTLCTAG